MPICTKPAKGTASASQNAQLQLKAVGAQIRADRPRLERNESCVRMAEDLKRACCLPLTLTRDDKPLCICLAADTAIHGWVRDEH
jgi:hypothetical protein